MDVRVSRLQKRISEKTKEITKMDKMIIDDCQKFINMENSLMELSIKFFNSQVIDTSDMTEIDVVNIIRKTCFI